MRITFFLLALLMSASCHTDTPINNSISKTTETYKATSLLDSALDLSRQIFNGMDSCERKLLPKKAFDKRALPMQNELDSLRTKLTPAEIRELDDYSIKRINQIVDFKTGEKN